MLIRALLYQPHHHYARDAQARIANLIAPDEDAFHELVKIVEAEGEMMR